VARAIDLPNLAANIFVAASTFTARQALHNTNQSIFNKMPMDRMK
jgi:hypothetical protein